MSSSVNNVRYVVITPMRDEERHVDDLCTSVLAQTIRPAEWIIVDDGSTDRTGAMIDGYAGKYPWIRVVHKKNRGARLNGSGVMEAFYAGYEIVQLRDWDYIVKLDGDLSFHPAYFEQCFAEFGKDPKLGIGGGVICHEQDGKPEVEKQPAFHVRGATKIYRAQCWHDIGGLSRLTGWDTLDELKANMLGWQTRSFPHLQLLHKRHTGAADGALRNAFKDGRADYVSTYHPLFFAAKFVKRLFRWPYFVTAAALAWGFLSGYLYRMPRGTDAQLAGYIRGQQLRRLFLRESIWK